MKLPKNLVACNIEYYTLAKEILIIQEGKNTRHLRCENIDKLSKMLYNICIDEKISDVLISGNNIQAKEIANEIIGFEVANYNRASININII